METIAKQTKDICVEKLTSTEGKDLEIMANLTSPGQINAVMEGYIGMFFNSKFMENQYQMLLRLSVSWQGRGRDDLTGIGKTPDLNPQGNSLIDTEYDEER